MPLLSFVFSGGIPFSSFQATILRDGVFNSSTLGPIDLNQELYDPMQEEIAPEWTKIMNSTLIVLLQSIKKSITEILPEVVGKLRADFVKEGGLAMDAKHLSILGEKAIEASEIEVDKQFKRIEKAAIQKQRRLSRLLMTLIKDQMKPRYGAALNVERGSGTFNRMKQAIILHGGDLGSVFDIPLSQVCLEMTKLIKLLTEKIRCVAKDVAFTLESLFEFCLNENQCYAAVVDAATKEKIESSRFALLQDMTRILKIQKKICGKLGIQLAGSEEAKTRSKSCGGRFQPSLNPQVAVKEENVDESSPTPPSIKCCKDADIFDDDSEDSDKGDESFFETSPMICFKESDDLSDEIEKCD